MPLFIPIGLGIAALASAAFGSKKAYDGVTDMRDAKRLCERAEAKHKEAGKLLESSRDHLRARLQQLQVTRNEIDATTA